jgi:hypothetical protein
MGIAERPASLAAVARVVPVARVVLEDLGVQVAQVVLAVLAVLEDRAAQVALVA